MRHTTMIFIFILFNSCKVNSQNKGFNIFKTELSKESIDKMAKYSPYSLSEKVVADYKYYPYYKKFGNSGICVQYNIQKDDMKQFKNRWKSYNHLQNNLLIFNDSSYVFEYNSPNMNLKTPELSEEIGDLSAVNLKDKKEVDIYIIEKGKIKNAFINGAKIDYNYSIGIYNFKNRSTLIYWFLLY